VAVITESSMDRPSHLRSHGSHLGIVTITYTGLGGAFVRHGTPKASVRQVRGRARLSNGLATWSPLAVRTKLLEPSTPAVVLRDIDLRLLSLLALDARTSQRV
jgi:hypothetical protein